MDVDSMRGHWLGAGHHRKLPINMASVLVGGGVTAPGASVPEPWGDWPTGHPWHGKSTQKARSLVASLRWRPVHESLALDTPGWWARMAPAVAAANSLRQPRQVQYAAWGRGWVDARWTRHKSTRGQKVQAARVMETEIMPGVGSTSSRLLVAVP